VTTALAERLAARLALALALVASLALARHASAEPRHASAEPRAASAESSHASAEELRRRTVDATAAPLPSRDTRWQALFGAALDAGSLPQVAPGITTGVDIRRGGLAARAVAAAFFPQADHGDAGRTGALSIALFDVMTTVCALAPIGGHAIGACGGTGLGIAHASRRASGGADGSGGTDATLRLLGTAQLRGDLALSRAIVIAVDAGVFADPLRTRLQLDGAPDSYRPPLFAFRASTALHVRFW